jgi:hypothetical protein
MLLVMVIVPSATVYEPRIVKSPEIRPSPLKLKVPLCSSPLKLPPFRRTSARARSKARRTSRTLTVNAGQAMVRFLRIRLVGDASAPDTAVRGQTYQKNERLFDDRLKCAHLEVNPYLAASINLDRSSRWTWRFQ